MNKERLENSDLTRTMLQVLFIGILIISSGWVLMPFLSSIIWAAIIVVATWPMFLWVQRRLWNRRGPAVALMSIALLLVLIIPLSFATVTVINRADDIAAWINAASVFEPPPAPGWLSKVPFVGPRMVDYWQQITDLRPEDLSPHLAPFAGKAARWFISQIGNVGMTVLQFIVTVIIAAIIYTNG